GLALIDLEPSPVGPPLHMAAFRVPMPGKTLRYVRIENLTALGCAIENGLERCAMLYDIDAAGTEPVPAPPVEYGQRVIVTVTRQTLRDAFGRVDQWAPGLANCAQVRFLNLDSGGAEHSERLGHAADLVAAAGRDHGVEVAFGNCQHAPTERC